MSDPIKPSQARICENEDHHIRPIVTAAATCPHCGEATDEHPEAHDAEQYCVECGGGPFPSDQCHVITDDEDPYMQIDDGDLICVCQKCKAKRDKEEAGA